MLQASLPFKRTNSGRGRGKDRGLLWEMGGGGGEKEEGRGRGVERRRREGGVRRRTDRGGGGEGGGTGSGQLSNLQTNGHKRREPHPGMINERENFAWKSPTYQKEEKKTPPKKLSVEDMQIEGDERWKSNLKETWTERREEGKGRNLESERASETVSESERKRE